MAEDSGIGYKVTATVSSVKGVCSAGLRTGQVFEISCYNSGGLCGFFYHSIFPNLLTFQSGGSLPWWKGDSIEVQCSDPQNLVILKLERTK